MRSLKLIITVPGGQATYLDFSNDLSLSLARECVISVTHLTEHGYLFLKLNNDIVLMEDESL
jgi:hypothetical protein